MGVDEGEKGGEKVGWVKEVRMMLGGAEVGIWMGWV